MDNFLTSLSILSIGQVKIWVYTFPIHLLVKSMKKYPFSLWFCSAFEHIPLKTNKRNLNNYFHLCLTFYLSSILHPYVQKLASIPAVLSKISLPNESCLVCVKNEKYAFWVTLRPSDEARWSRATYIKIHLVVSSPISVTVTSSCVC